MLSLVGASFFVGIDWAARTHAVCVLDPTGKQLATFAIDHTAAGFTGLIRRLAKLGPPSSIPQQAAIAIERPDGRLVDALLADGHPVVPVKPIAIKTCRELLWRCWINQQPYDPTRHGGADQLPPGHQHAALPDSGTTSLNTA